MFNPLPPLMQKYFRTGFWIATEKARGYPLVLQAIDISTPLSSWRWHSQSPIGKSPYTKRVRELVVVHSQHVPWWYLGTQHESQQLEDQRVLITLVVSVLMYSGILEIEIWFFVEKLFSMAVTSYLRRYLAYLPLKLQLPVTQSHPLQNEVASSRTY